MKKPSYDQITSRGAKTSPVYAIMRSVIEAYITRMRIRPSQADAKRALMEVHGIGTPSQTTIKNAYDAFMRSQDLEDFEHDLEAGGGGTIERNDSASQIIALSQSAIAAQINAAAEKLIAPERAELAKQLEANAREAIAARSRADRMVADVQAQCAAQVSTALAEQQRVHADAEQRVAGVELGLIELRKELDRLYGERSAALEAERQIRSALTVAHESQRIAHAERDGAVAALAALSQQVTQSKGDAEIAYSALQKSYGERIGALSGEIDALKKQLAAALAARDREIDRKTKEGFAYVAESVTGLATVLQTHQAEVRLQGAGSANREQALFEQMQQLAKAVAEIESKLVADAHREIEAAEKIQANKRIS